MKISVQEDAGGTMVLTLPSEVVDQLHLADGSSVELTVDEGSLIVRPHRRRNRHTLDELINSSDPRAFERTPEDEEWFNSPPVGRELI